MVLPKIANFCDAVELAAIFFDKPLFSSDLAAQFFPGQDAANSESELADVLALASERMEAAPANYPFEVSARRITFSGGDSFNVYLFLLLGRALSFGGPAGVGKLRDEFRRYFEDVVCWALKKRGFHAEVISIPREFRGLNKQLIPALTEISERFGESAIVNPTKVDPHDNDLDVDVVVAPIRGNRTRGGWPTLQIQCATGNLEELSGKIESGSGNFGSVWEDGFYSGCQIRVGATPHDLLRLGKLHWNRLGLAGCVLDRMRLAYIGETDLDVPLLKELKDFWRKLWNARTLIDWQTGWQGVVADRDE